MPTTEEIRTSIAEVVAEVSDHVEADQVTPEKEFVADLRVDSLAMVEVVVILEEAHDLRIPDDDVRGFRSVGDLVTYLEQRLGQTGTT